MVRTSLSSTLLVTLTIAFGACAQNQPPSTTPAAEGSPGATSSGGMMGGQGMMGQGMGPGMMDSGQGMMGGMMPAMHAQVEDVDKGARLKMTPTDPAKLKEMRDHMKQHAQMMNQSHGCSMMVDAGR